MKLAPLLNRLTQFGKFQHWATPRVWWTAASVAGIVVLIRLAGGLQTLELASYDLIVRLRPSLKGDDRIVIVQIDDRDITEVGTWPIPDRTMAELLEQIKRQQPRAIGLDIYRDVPVGEGHTELEQVFKTTPNLIGIEKMADDYSGGVEAPAALVQRGQVGFNNVVVDVDGRVRRSTLYWHSNDGSHESFALKLATLFLQPTGIQPEPATVSPQYMQMGQGVFYNLQPNDGAYIRADTRGYQILANLRGGNGQFTMVSMRQVLKNEIDRNLMRDRIVLIGSTAASLKDFFYTSYTGGLVGNILPMPGVELQAHFISQLLTAAETGRSLITVIPEPLEIGWIVIWSLIGTRLSWTLRSSIKTFLAITVSGVVLVVTGYLSFIGGVWLPIVPPLLSLVGASVAITGYIAHLREELKKSKEFLQSVINTIPDPIFVKDQHHRWIVLNDAFCRFIGYSKETLLEKTDHDFFSLEQADVFWQQDELVFQVGIEQEHEEALTNATGTTYDIATKRSLHRDAAGNRFLVGVIRDITERKRMEAELRRTAAELVRSNAELRQAENRLRRMAYFDTLTGLPNRDLLTERLSQALALAQDHNRLVAVLFLDLDGFKRINDTHGHDMGNLLLKAVSQRLTGCLRGSDTVARLGGDEFVVLLPAVPSASDVTRVAEKILNRLCQKFLLEETHLQITTSIGISLYPTHGKDMDTLLKQADLAMYTAKSLGKNRYQFAEPQE